MHQFGHCYSLFLCCNGGQLSRLSGTGPHKVFFGRVAEWRKTAALEIVEIQIEEV